MPYFKYSLSAFLAIIITYAAFLYFGTIHHVVEEGKAYGFEIGQSRKNVLDIILQQRESKNYSYFYGWLDIKINGVDTNKIIEYQLDELSMEKLESLNPWNVNIDSTLSLSISNKIRFIFDEDKLIQIYRHRQYIELP